MAVDYQVLLGKYMTLVRQVEGTDFVDHVNDSFSMNDVRFTPEEATELTRISAQITSDRSKG